MARKKVNKFNQLNEKAQFVLFATSYTPLFVLIVVKQISENYEALTWGGLNLEALLFCVKHFGLSILLISISIFGFTGFVLTFNKLNKDSVNGENVIVKRVENKNSESIGYIATYIVPFLFQSFNGWYESFALIFLMLIIYRIYVNSNLILVNPILSFKYSLFEIEYVQQNETIKNGLVIIRGDFIEEKSLIKIYEIGFKLYFATIKQD